MIGHPFPGLAPRALRRRIALAAAVAVVAGATMLLLEPVLSDRGAGIVELELAGSGRTQRILDDWGARGCDAEGYHCATGDAVWRAKAIVLVDFAFLAAYGIGGAALFALLADRHRHRRPAVPRGFELLAWTMLAAAVLDGLENTALWQVLVLETRGYAEAATVFAVAKFTLLAGAVGAAPVLLVAGRSPRSRGPGSPAPTPVQDLPLADGSPRTPARGLDPRPRGGRPPRRPGVRRGQRGGPVDEPGQGRPLRARDPG